MQVILFFLGFILIIGLGYFILTKTYRKQLNQEKLIVKHHKKRRTFLHNKVLQLFEMDRKHQQNLKILENEVEQLQHDIALKHTANDL